MAPDQTKAAKQWAEGAKDALDSAHKLFDSKKYQHALFFCHLAVEKALKSRYIADCDEVAPYVHDLRLLASKLKLPFNAKQQEQLAELNTFNIAGRYEAEKMDLYQKATPEYTQAWLTIAQELLDYFSL